MIKSFNNLYLLIVFLYMHLLLAGFVSDILLFKIQSVWLLYQHSIDLFFILGGLGVVCWIMACRTAVARVTSLWSLSQSPEETQTFAADRQPLDIPLDWCVLFVKYFVISLPRTPHLLTVEILQGVSLNASQMNYTDINSFINYCYLYQ